MERLLLLLFMGVLFFSCSDSSINKESNNTTQNMEQRSLTSMYTDLINSFEDVSAPGLDGVSILYPDYFGGAYVKDDKVVIFLTKESDKDFVKKDLSKRIDLNYVSFVECDYSYAELMDLDKWLFDFFTKNRFQILRPLSDFRSNRTIWNRSPHTTRKTTYLTPVS